MGYYTDFELEIKNDPDGAAKSKLMTESGYNDWEDGELQGVKWYEWKEHLTKVSKAYPEVTFILSGVGEEYPDIWRAWAKNGRVEVVKAIVEFPTPSWV